MIFPILYFLKVEEPKPPEPPKLKGVDYFWMDHEKKVSNRPLRVKDREFEDLDSSDDESSKSQGGGPVMNGGIPPPPPPPPPPGGLMGAPPPPPPPPPPGGLGELIFEYLSMPDP